MLVKLETGKKDPEKHTQAPTQSYTHAAQKMWGRGRGSGSLITVFTHCAVADIAFAAAFFRLEIKQVAILEMWDWNGKNHAPGESTPESAQAARLQAIFIFIDGLKLVPRNTHTWLPPARNKQHDFLGAIS